MPVNSHNLLVSSDLGIITPDKHDAKNIYVTQPTLPPLEEFVKYLQKIKFISGVKMNIDYVPQDGRFSFEATDKKGENRSCKLVGNAYSV